MKMTTILTIAALATLGTQALADSYQVNVARVQLDLACTIDKSSGGSTDCSMNVKSQDKLALTLNQDEKGYTGIDQVSDPAGQYMVAVSADANKQIQSVSLLRLQANPDGKSAEVALTSTAASTLNAVNISPLIVSVDGQIYKLQMTVVAYAPAASINMVTASDKVELKNYILEKVQPALNALH